MLPRTEDMHQYIVIMIRALSDRLCGRPLWLGHFAGQAKVTEGKDEKELSHL